MFKIALCKNSQANYTFHMEVELYEYDLNTNKTYGMKDAKPQTLTYVALVQYAFYDLHFGTMVQLKSNVNF